MESTVRSMALLPARLVRNIRAHPQQWSVLGALFGIWVAVNYIVPVLLSAAWLAWAKQQVVGPSSGSARDGWRAHAGGTGVRCHLALCLPRAACTHMSTSTIVCARRAGLGSGGLRRRARGRASEDAAGWSGGYAAAPGAAQRGPRRARAPRDAAAAGRAG